MAAGDAKVIHAHQRHFSDFGWLKTYWLFSFSDYHDPGNVQFGPLRVYNDDVVEPGQGFPTHPHREMEIVTVVLEGEMTHEDSMGNRAVIKAGDVQRMSAGTGLTHSEFNLAKRPVHFHQIWILPGEAGLKPTYDQRSFRPDQWRNRLLPVASGREVPDAVTLHADATLYRAELDQGTSVRLAVTGARRVFVYATSGEVEIAGRRLEAGDQARLDADGPLDLTARSAAGLVLIDLPAGRR